MLVEAHGWHSIVKENRQKYQSIIIESVDSVSGDGPDTPICIIICYKKRNNSEQVIFFKAF